MARRILSTGASNAGLAQEANEWLMRILRRECRRSSVTAVHAYEDCSLWAFEEARRLGKACIYDLPIAYHEAWREIHATLWTRFADWLPAGAMNDEGTVTLRHKRREMELADIVLVPCSFVRRTVERRFDKPVAVAGFGVDVDFWRPSDFRPPGTELRFIYAGQCSLRKGIPVLLEAWHAAALEDATLSLVGPWRLAESRRGALPPGVTLTGAVSLERLREYYQSADVFVFPSFFEGFGLVILEAMACGLPVITTDATAGPDVVDVSCGRIDAPGDLDALVESLRWFSAERDRIPSMKKAARKRAEGCGWEAYRRQVSAAVGRFIR
ncbi:MAG: glycosyltransferase family 4 protein [Burkholderiales bacterium]|nr:glycosyltransferase family 4 protein [Burkholderiales bacterium]